MNAMKNKIKSQRGASITFALLIFLVCAVVSSVVIVAATTAAGRMSEQADMDERYYAVNAVARQLIDIMDGKEVVLEYTKTDPSVIAGPTGISDILLAASKGVVQQAIKKESERADITIPVTGSTAIKNGEDGAECTAEGILKTDGTLVFDINAKTDKNNRVYDLKLTFASTLKNTATDSSKTTASATVKWKLLGAEKTRSDR